MTIHSMTGYALQTREVGRGVLHLELRSVNSRYLDISLRVGDELRMAEPLLREVIAARLNRGKIECRLNLLPSAAGPRELTLNQTLLRQLRDMQDAVRLELPEAASLDVAEVLRWPGMLGDDAMPAEKLQAECAALAGAALDDFVATRAREGTKMAAAILQRVERMRTLVAETAPRLPQVLADYQERLAFKLREALAVADEERIRQEIGVFAARIDVSEEVSRLSAHLDEVARVIEKGGAVGKRLDFLMQELNREANTLASKSVATEITGIALELKLLIEQMREQIQNIE